MSDDGKTKAQLLRENESLRRELRSRDALLDILNGGVTGTDGSAPDFADLFDLDEIQAVQDAFSRAMGVASLITDPQGRPLTRPSNFCRLCSEIIRKTERGLANCMRSDAIIGRQNLDGPILQPCLSGGLWDGGASISVGGRHIANWLVGQVRDEDEDEDRLRAYARDIGADEEAFLAAWREVPQMPVDQFRGVCDALFLMANLMSRLALAGVTREHEIRRRRATEKQLDLTENVAMTLLNATRDSAFLVDADGTFLAANAVGARRLGARPEELLGRTAAGRIGWEQFERRVLTIHDVLCNGRTIRFEDRFGDQVFANVFTPVHDERGRPWAVAVFARNVTEQKRLEQLREDVERITRHDIKSPLTGIIGLARILSGQDNLTERQREFAATITEAATHTLGLLNASMDLSRMEMGTYLLRPRAFDVAATLRRIRKVLHLLAGKRRVEVTLLIEGRLLGEADEAFYLGEERHVESMLHNLVLNAIEAAPEDSNITVGVRLDMERMVVDIHHSGLVPDAVRHRFFEKYATFGKEGGTGLGNHSARLIARAHGGDVTFTSEPGHGTHVVARLPQALPDPAQGRAERAVAP